MCIYIYIYMYTCTQHMRINSAHKYNSSVSFQDHFLQELASCELPFQREPLGTTSGHWGFTKPKQCEYTYIYIYILIYIYTYTHVYV